MSGRHSGAAQRPGRAVLWVTLVVVLAAVPVGVIALVIWFSTVATERELRAGPGLLMLAAAISTFLQAHGRRHFRWSAAGEALLASWLLMNAAAPRQVPAGYTVASDSMIAVAVACLGMSIVLGLRSGALRFRRPSWLRRGSPTPG